MRREKKPPVSWWAATSSETFHHVGGDDLTRRVDDLDLHALDEVRECDAEEDRDEPRTRRPSGASRSVAPLPRSRSSSATRMRRCG